LTVKVITLTDDEERRKEKGRKTLGGAGGFMAVGGISGALSHFGAGGEDVRRRIVWQDRGDGFLLNVSCHTFASNM
jgi:hypothetical protein